MADISSTHVCPTCAEALTLSMDDKHRYTMTCACGKRWLESVTQILETSARAPFGVAAWHGQSVGIEGVQRLVNDGDLSIGALRKMPPHVIASKMTAAKITVNHKRDARGTSGTGLHKAMEDYGKNGTIPRAADFPAEDRPRLRGLAEFFLLYRPEFLATEVQVVSVKHRFAGTFDFLANIHGEVYDDRKLKRLAFRPSDTATTFTLGDLKTAKYVYPTKNFAQLEGYEGARVEAGEPPTDARAVLWVGPNGEMDLVPSSATFEDFLALKASAEVIDRLDSSYTRPKAKR